MSAVIVWSVLVLLMFSHLSLHPHLVCNGSETSTFLIGIWLSDAISDKFVTLWVNVPSVGNSRVHQAYSAITLVFGLQSLIPPYEMLLMMRAFCRPDGHLSLTPPLWPYITHMGHYGTLCFKSGLTLINITLINTH